MVVKKNKTHMVKHKRTKKINYNNKQKLVVKNKKHYLTKIKKNLLSKNKYTKWQKGGNNTKHTNFKLTPNNTNFKLTPNLLYYSTLRARDKTLYSTLNERDDTLICENIVNNIEEQNKCYEALNAHLRNETAHLHNNNYPQKIFQYSVKPSQTMQEEQYVNTSLDNIFKVFRKWVLNKDTGKWKLHYYKKTIK